MYALGEGAGVVAAHRWDRHVGGPEADAATRTAFVIGKSVIGAALGLVALQQVAAIGSSVPVQVLAAFAGVAVSTAFDHATVAAMSAAVGGRSFPEELRRGLGELTLIGVGEVIAGALIAVLAVRDPWSLLLGLAMLGLLLVAGSAYARAAADREDTRELLRLAEALQEADTIDEVEATLIASVRRLLPLDEVRIDARPPDERHRGWALDVTGTTGRWLVSPRIVDTRDYEQQPMRVVDAAVSLARVALNRAAEIAVDIAADGAKASLDAVGLERIVENLVMNACKYSPPGGTVRVRCAAADRQLIFQPFQQAGREGGGVGLGLYVARRFAELHGGRIWVDDAPSGGAAFHVWLPGPRPEADGRPSATPTGGRDGPAR